MQSAVVDAGTGIAGRRTRDGGASTEPRAPRLWSAAGAFVANELQYNFWRNPPP